MPKRRAEWALGRRTAKLVTIAALEAAFPDRWSAAELEIASEPGGAPFVRLAPEAAPAGGFTPRGTLPVALSISHAGGRALCAAAPLRPGCPAALGADLGELEPRSEALVATFFTEDERRLVRDAPGGERDLWANFVWCAKEAVLKALRLGLTVDTLELTCLPAEGSADPGRWPLSPADPSWRPFTAACGPALLPGGGTIEGIWRTFPGYVAAVAARW